jgi:hypothetical protein
MLLLLQFLLRVVVAVGIYVLLVLPWPGVREAYRDVYRWTASALFEKFGADGSIEFILPGEDELADAKAQPAATDVIAVFERRVQTREMVRGRDGRVGYVPVTEVNKGWVKIPTGRVGWVAIAWLIAFILASPTAWSRKAWALLWGLVLVNVFIALRLLLFSVYWFSQANDLAVYHPGPMWSKMLTQSYEYFFVSPYASFVVPAFIWALVALRREDLARVMEQARRLTGGTETIRSGR